MIVELRGRELSSILLGVANPIGVIVRSIGQKTCEHTVVGFLVVVMDGFNTYRETQRGLILRMVIQIEQRRLIIDIA